jgi:hypothetical protein
MNRRLFLGCVYRLPGKRNLPMDHESDSGGSTKKTLIIVLSIVGGLVLLCGLSCVGFGVWAFKKYGDLPQVAVNAELFGENIATDDIAAAYAQTSRGFQEKQTLEEFKALLQRYPSLKSATSHTLSNMDVKETPNGMEAHVQEIVSGPNGSNTVSLTLVKEEGLWKVDSISVR